MEKWHINKSGNPARCRAVKNPCPLGGKHFDSKDETQKYVNEKFQKKHGFLPTISGANYTNYIDLQNENKKHVAQVIKEVSGTKTAGFEYECFASATIANRMNLNQIAVINEKGRLVGVSTDSNPHDNRRILKKAIESVEQFYTNQGVQIGDKSLLARVVYFSSDPDNNKVLVQSGGPNVLDAAIIEADNVVDIIEVKKLHKGGAQMPSTVIDVNEQGEVDINSLNGSGEYIKDALSKLKIQDADGHNVKVDFGSPENNENYPLYHFIDEYKRKGARTFLYTSADGMEIKEINLNRPTLEVAEEMKSKGIYANIKLRANIQKRPSTQSDTKRFDNYTGAEYFKSKEVPKGNFFKLGDLDKSKMSVSNGNIRIGGYILPIPVKAYNDETIVDKRTMEAFRLTLIGDIKVR